MGWICHRDRSCRRAACIHASAHSQADPYAHAGACYTYAGTYYYEYPPCYEYSPYTPANTQFYGIL